MHEELHLELPQRVYRSCIRRGRHNPHAILHTTYYALKLDSLTVFLFCSQRLDESLEVVCTDITLCQLNALYALPSVGNALDESPLARGFDARESVLKSELPKWLQAMGRARVRRACAMRCALSLLQSAFPGGNRHKTSARQLYLDTVDKPLLGACAVVMALKKVLLICLEHSTS